MYNIASNLQKNEDATKQSIKCSFHWIELCPGCVVMLMHKTKITFYARTKSKCDTRFSALFIIQQLVYSVSAPNAKLHVKIQSTGTEHFYCFFTHVIWLCARYFVSMQHLLKCTHIAME